MKWTRALQFAAVALAVTSAAACGQYETVAGSASAAESPASAGAAKLEVSRVALVAADSAQLGQLVTDGQGRALYRFDEDTARPSKSNCDGDCATAWPPLIAADNVEVRGVDQVLIGTVERSDGSKQVTFAGWPLYHYVKDTAPGDVNGHGAGDRWFAVTPQGKKAGGTVAAPVALVAMNVAPFGELVTDREGMTLYRFDQDKANPPTSNCADACAVQWPPVITASDTIDVQGVDNALVGTVERPDGTKQVTLGGWPLYRFAGDTVPCDTNGHGLDGVWFAVTPAGKKAPLA